MNKFIKAIFIISLILIHASAFAQPVQHFGYVNVIDVMMLHPTMRYFDLSTKRFSLSAFKGINIQERIEEDKVKIRIEINKLNDELKKFDDKLKEMEETYLERSSHLIKSNESLKTMTKKRRQKYEEDIAAMQAEFYSKSAEVRRKAFPIKEKIKKLEQSSKFTGYTNEKETRSLFSLMLDDVYEAMNACAKMHNCSFVFNSSASINYIETESNVFFDTPNSMPEFFDNYKKLLKDNEESEANTIMGGHITQWLSERNSVFKNCSDNRLTMFVMNGGINLTPDVINYIYKKHKISKEHQEFIYDYYQKIIIPGTNGFNNF